MRVDFYQLSRDPVDHMVALIAAKVLDAQGRLLVVAADRGLLEAISAALWKAGGGAFLANGFADAPHAERQPVLLSHDCAAANGAQVAILADGVWREEAASLERVLLAFGPDRLQDARDLWRSFDAREGAERHIFKQGEDGRWREGA